MIWNWEDLRRRTKSRMHPTEPQEEDHKSGKDIANIFSLLQISNLTSTSFPVINARYFNTIIISNIKAGRTNDQLKQLLGARSICNREMSVPDKCDCTHKNVNDGTHKNLNGLLLISRGSGRFWNICSSVWRHIVPGHNLVEL